MDQDFQKYTLQDAISKIMWNLRFSYQSKNECSPFEIHFNSKPNTTWKQLAFFNSINRILDKGKSIHCKEKALD